MGFRGAAVASGVRGVADEFHALEGGEVGRREGEGVEGGDEGGLGGGWWGGGWWSGELGGLFGAVEAVAQSSFELGGD